MGPRTMLEFYSNKHVVIFIKVHIFFGKFCSIHRYKVNNVPTNHPPPPSPQFLKWQIEKGKKRSLIEKENEIKPGEQQGMVI